MRTRRSVGHWYLDRYRAVQRGTDALPLSPAQRRFAGNEMLTGRREILAMAYRVAEADPARLGERALRLTEAQPALRSRLCSSGAVPYQVVEERPHVDCTGAPPGPDAVAPLLRSVESPDGPVWGLRTLPDGDAVLVVLAFDHRVVDERSLHEILAWLFADADAVHRPGVTVGQYRAALVQSLEEEVAGTTEAALEHWLDRLDGLGGHDLPPAEPASEVTGSTSTHEYVRLPPDRMLWRSLVPVAASCFDRAAAEAFVDASPPQRPLVGIGLGRSSMIPSHVVGAFFNLLPYVPPHEFAPAPAEVPRVMGQWLDDLEHGDVALDTIAGALATRGARGRRLRIGAYVTVERRLTAARPEQPSWEGMTDVWLEQFGSRAPLGGSVVADEGSGTVRLRVVAGNDPVGASRGRRAARRWAGHVAAMSSAEADRGTGHGPDVPAFSEL